MSKLSVKAYQIETSCNRGYWQDRILFQIKYAIQLSDIRNGKYDSIIEETEDFLLSRWNKEKCITPETAKQAENMLLPLSVDAKSFKIHCVSHAHIDMNWMWRFDETVAITLDTFRTMLDLLAEYPEFTFSQSQASVYKIVEEFGPAGMLDEIKKYVKEGRWEVTASTWVEADKNTPNGESAARHLLYTRRYLSKLLDIPLNQVRIDFEPDTFGHSANIPDILADGGVEYYYHCRGSVDPHLIWWQAPSGKRVLSYCETNWYNCEVGPDFMSKSLHLCKELGIDAMLKLYGVGDHGGGPSRRDIERIADMRDWPVHPTVIFSTYHAFFDYIRDNFGEKLPVRNTEMNPIFSGCYTSQSRIKMANRIGESTLYEAELFGSLANPSAGFAYSAERFETAWQSVLFNQFHDILTGSGVMDTREYAMGQFQRCMATANTEKLNAIRAIAAKIDTSCFDNGEVSGYRTEGAGVGSGIAGFHISQVDRGSGPVRVYHVFNAAPFEREGLAELTVWDWDNTKLPLIEFSDERGNKIPHQLLKSGNEWYWFHHFVTVLIPVKVPACGWATYTLKESDDTIIPAALPEPEEWQVVEPPHNYILENKHVKICFDTSDAYITSFVDKKSGKEWIKPGQRGGFRLIEEDTNRNMSSWRVGRYMNIKQFDSVRIKPVFNSGAELRQSIMVETTWGRSALCAVFSLDKDSSSLTVSADCDWGERGKPGECIPQLNFALPLSDKKNAYCYDIPMGTIVRKEADIDMPGNSFVTALPKEENTGFMLSTDTKYGYRGFNGVLSAALIRGSYDPDPTPEYGQHKFSLSAGPVKTDRGEMVRHAFSLWHPFNTLASSAHKGSLSLSGSFADLESENAVLQAVKMPEDGSSSAIFRIYNTCGQNEKAILRVNHISLKDTAEIVTVNEIPTGQTLLVKNGETKFNIPPYSSVNIRVFYNMQQQLTSQAI